MHHIPVLEYDLQEKSNSSKTEIYYPESDGKPVGETDWHISAIFYLRQALRFFFRNQPDVYTAADMLFYYEEGVPTIFKVPDVFVVKGVTKQDRRTYKLWEEQVTPHVIFEITSRGTRLEDVGEKKGLYAYLGVKEYFLFDPLDEYLKPRLQGFRLIGEHYEPIPLAKDGTLTSRELNVILRPGGNLLRVVDPKTGEEIPSLEESAEKAVEALELAQVEAQRADVAEAELERLRAELAQLRKQQIGQ
jgi:Uma2 family endonuclease